MQTFASRQGEEAHGFPSVINSSGRPSQMIASRPSQENLLKDNPQVPGPQGHPPGMVSWLTPTFPLPGVIKLFLIFMDPSSAAIHARMLPNEESYSFVCGGPSHRYEFLAVHLGLSLLYSNLHFLWWQKPQGTCHVKDSLPCIINSSKPIWDPPNPPIHVLWAPALLILSSRTEISFAVPYISTPLAHSAVRGDFPFFMEQNREDSQYRWINEVLPLEYSVSKDQQCHWWGREEVHPTSWFKYKLGLQIKAGLFERSQLKPGIWFWQNGTSPAFLVPSDPSFYLHWDNASERGMGRRPRKKHRGGRLPMNCCCQY